VNGVLLFYFAVTLFVLLGQLAVVGIAWAIGRRMKRSSLATLFLIAYGIGLARTIYGLPLYQDETLVQLIETYSSWHNLLSALGQPLQLWLVFWALLLLYGDLPRRTAL
jgi:glucan phosphoethanolaminetransferase (alkaline phosphatase superfamily)